MMRSFLATAKDMSRAQKKDLILTTITINILSLALPTMTLQVYDRILPNPGTGTLPVLVTGVAVAIILEIMLRLWRSYLLGWAGAAFEHNLSCKVMKHVLNTNLSSSARVGVGEHLNRLTSISKLKDFYSGYSTVVLLELFLVPFYILLIAYISGPLALVPVVVLMTFVMIFMAQGQNLRHSLRKRDDADNKRYDFLIESVEGIHTVKSFALENHFARRYEKLEEKSVAANLDVIERSSRSNNIGALYTQIMLVAVIAAGASLVLYGGITTGALVATILLSGRIMQPVQKGLGLWMRYQDYTIAHEKVGSIFETPTYVQIENKLVDKTQREGTLTVEGVSFYSQDRENRVLDNVSFHLDKGECVTLDSDRVLSATMLLEMISGIYPPSTGNIVVNNINVGQCLAEEMIKSVGYIQNEGTIFRGTIRDNLTCFGMIPEVTVREVSALLDVDKDIAALPSGYDTFLSGNNSDIIPPGLRQRICIVRALAHKPRIILFDNADKSLDREGYNLVYNLLARLHGKATIIMATEDLNLRALASRSLVIEDGRLSERPIENNDRISVTATQIG